MAMITVGSNHKKIHLLRHLCLF